MFSSRVTNHINAFRDAAARKNNGKNAFAAPATLKDNYNPSGLKTTPPGIDTSSEKPRATY